MQKLTQNIMLINNENLTELKRKLNNVYDIGLRDAETTAEHYRTKIRMYEQYLQHNPEQISVEDNHHMSNTRNYDKIYIQQLEEKRYLQDKYNYVTSGSFNKSY